MRNPTPRSTFAPLAVVFFFHWCASGMWNVPFSNILKAAGMEGFIASAFACNAIAAFVSPLLVGSLVDRGFHPLRLLRGLYWASAVLLALAFLAIDRKANGFVMLALIQLHSLCFCPTTSLVTSIGMTLLQNPSREFGPLRTAATIGWIIAGCVVSWVLAADGSPLAGYTSAAIILALGLATFWLPEPTFVSAGRARNWRELLGLDALRLLQHPDHRTILITVTLFGVPLAAFYPFTPLHLSALGFAHPTATMSLGQISEIVGLLSLAFLAQHIRLKWVILGGLLFGVLRFGLFSLNMPAALLAGIAVHGACYTLHNVTAQIYLAERVEPEMRARAQALFVMLTTGVCNLFGYLGTGWLFQVSRDANGQRWPLYWGVLCGVTVIITVYFFRNYHGVGHGFFRRAEGSADSR
jgi:MFS family permease